MGAFATWASCCATRGLCFPSLYEGFGLPAIEAMQVGTAVLTSCMSEIVGDAALTVDPSSTREMAGALALLDRDDELRIRFEQAGPARAALFSPARFAERLNSALRAPGREASRGCGMISIGELLPGADEDFVINIYLAILGR